MNRESEIKFLDNLHKDYITSNESPYLRNMRNLVMKNCLEHMEEGKVGMELGCEVGYMTSLISPNVLSLDVIEGCEKFIIQAKMIGLKNVTFYNMLFEEVTAKDRYDYVFASHVIEHLVDPVGTLKVMYDALKEGGKIFVTVPNAFAASRQLALKMGLLYDLFALTPNDMRGGHRRVYEYDTIVKDLHSAGFEITASNGLLFKPFSDFQMDQLIESGFLTQQHLDGLENLGYENPDLCGAIFLVGEKI